MTPPPPPLSLSAIDIAKYCGGWGGGGIGGAKIVKSLVWPEARAFVQAHQIRQNSGGGGCTGVTKIRQRGVAVIFYFLRDKNITF